MNIKSEVKKITGYNIDFIFRHDIYGVEVCIKGAKDLKRTNFYLTGNDLMENNTPEKTIDLIVKKINELKKNL